MNIKKLFIIVGFLSLSSCDSFLEVDNVGRTSIPVYFSDMEGIRAALPGAYSKAYDYYNSEFLLYPDLAGDMVNLNIVGEDAKMFREFNFQSTPADELTSVGHIWRNAYEALANVNNILEYQPALVEKFPDNTKELEEIKAEALFLRALVHFDLVRVYAQPYNFTPDASHLGIPVLLKTPGPDKNPPRSTVSETYDQIVEDLTLAEILFEGVPPNDSYHASKTAVQALLSKVYLYMEDWQKAVEYATIVIDNSQLSYGQDYIDMFRSNEVGDEAIFRLNGYHKTPTIANFYAPAGPTAYASQKLVNLFSDSTDVRLDLLELNPNGGYYSTLKYSKPNLSEEETQYDIFVLRTSEIYLIRAEAYAHLDLLSEAAEDLKTIQARALQKKPSEISTPALNTENLLNLIAIERAKELSFEGQRFFDLIRTKQDLERTDDTNSTVQKISYPSSLFVLPIPSSEIEANHNIVQNPDY